MGAILRKFKKKKVKVDEFEGVLSVDHSVLTSLSHTSDGTHVTQAINVTLSLSDVHSSLVDEGVCAVVYVCSGSGFYLTVSDDSWRLVGQSETVSHCSDPAFHTAFIVNYNFASCQALRIDVFKGAGDLVVDSDEFLAKAVLVSRAQVILGSILSTRNHSMSVPLHAPSSPSAYTMLGLAFPHITDAVAHISITVNQKLEQCVAIFMAALELRHPKLKIPPSSFVILYRVEKDGSVTPIRKTQYVANVSCPSWEPIIVSFQKLCDCDRFRVILFRIFQFNPRLTKHVCIGEITTTFNDIFCQRKLLFELHGIDPLSRIGIESNCVASYLYEDNDEREIFKNLYGGNEGKDHEVQGRAGWSNVLTTCERDALNRRTASAVYHIVDRDTDEFLGNRYSKINEKKGRMKKKKSYISVEGVIVERIRTFLDYLSNGLSLNTIFGIDYSVSNGRRNDPTSLHNTDGYVRFISYQGQIESQTQNVLSDRWIEEDSNDYINCMRLIGSVTGQYSNGLFYDIRGFGCLPVKEIRTNQSFPINKNVRSSLNLPGLVSSYCSSFSQLTLSGPSCLAPLIRDATRWAVDHELKAKSKSSDTLQLKDQQSISVEIPYFLLILMTDGEVSDYHETIDAIVDASYAPLSILIIGIGDRCSFNQMVDLDSDFQMLESCGRLACRDVVQFVEFAQFADDYESFTEECLDEFPSQVVTYLLQTRQYSMSSRGSFTGHLGPIQCKIYGNDSELKKKKKKKKKKRVSSKASSSSIRASDAPNDGMD